MTTFNLGKDSSGAPVEIPAESLKRHFVCLGSSGSGKTVACKVLCEEFVRKDIPIIAIDPQGDIASLFFRGEPEAIKEQGVDESLLREFDQKAEVIIWTPASSKGIPLSINPLDIPATGKAGSEEIIKIISVTARNVVSVLGYDPDKDDGREAETFISLTLEHIHKKGESVRTFGDLSDFISSLPDALRTRTSRIINGKGISAIIKKLEFMTVGSRSLLYEMGVPLNIDTLLGLDHTSAPESIPVLEGEEEGGESDAERPSKTRVSVIYLNTLSSQEEKEFFVGNLVQKLYQWMLANPSKGLQALFYIDEIAPYLPPTRKTGCSDSLKLLFKQARKYGISCLIASQNPGDIDYKSLSQFATWNLGRLVTKQDIKKVSNMIKSIAPYDVDSIVSSLPRLKSGNFMLLSPDNFSGVVNYKVRWLVTQHMTIEEEQLPDMMTDRIRGRLVPKKEEEGEALEEEITEELEEEPEEEHEEEEEDQDQGTSPSRPSRKKPAPARAHKERGDKGAYELKYVREMILEYLRSNKKCVTRQELKESLDVSEGILRGSLDGLEGDKKIKKGRLKNAHCYWHNDYGFDPSRGVVSAYNAARLLLVEREIVKKAEKMLETKFFSRLEEVSDIKFRHIPLWKVSFEKTLKSGFIFKKSRTHKDSIYFDSKGEKLIVFEEGEGFKFSEFVSIDPLEIKDLDDVCQWTELLPGEIEFSWRRLKEMIPEKKLRALLNRKFRITVLGIELVFFPLWEVFIKNRKTGKVKKALIDGVCGARFQR